jgi:hypothetical protein
MKLMDGAAMIELATASESSIAAAAQKLEPLVGSSAYDDVLMRDIRAGKISSLEVRQNGKPEYVFFYSVTQRNFLEINATAFVGAGEPKTQLWIDGVEKFARGCQRAGIIFVTKRRGLVDVAGLAGYMIDGILMSKKL